MRPIIDPRISALIPQLSSDELGGLRAALLSDGCRDPLVVWEEEGILLDGHNRLHICESNGLDYHTSEISFPDRDAATAWVLSNQLSRRNLNNWQRAKLALAMKEVLSRKAHDRMWEGWADRGKADPDQNSGQDNADPVLNSAQDRQPPVRDQLASIAGVGHDTIHKAGVIEAKADDDTKEALEAGDITIHAAYKKVEGGNSSRKPGRIGKSKQECHACAQSNRRRKFYTICPECYALLRGK